MARVGLNSRKITPETEANACLIAAAPDLLAACKDTMGLVDASRRDFELAIQDADEKQLALAALDLLEEKIRAAIAKAEGK